MRPLLPTFLFILTLCLYLMPASARQGTILVDNLRVDHLVAPDLRVINGYPATGSEQPADRQTVISNGQPSFGWQILSETTGTRQSSFRLIIGTDQTAVQDGRGDTWDSGKVDSPESTNVLYAGPPLQAETTNYWRVMIWDSQGTPSPWSPLQKFVTAKKLSDYKTSAYPLQKTDEVPIKVVKSGKAYHLDFGRASFGQLRMTLTSQDGGESVTVHLGEAVTTGGLINRKPGGTIRYAKYQIRLQPGRHTYFLQLRPDKRNTGPQAIKIPAYIGEVLPFRYCEIEGYNSELAAHDVVRATVHYPFNDFAAHFESSDTTLNAIWELCKYSIKATSFAGIYVDGDRERIPYEADAYINQLCHYGVDSEYSMARRSHEYLLHNATWPTEWILQSVLMAYNDYLYTGDIRSADHYYADLKAKLLLPLRQPNGFITTTGDRQTTELLKSIHFKGKALRDIVDWPHTGSFGMEGKGETDGFVFTDYNAVVNAFHYKALRDMEHLAAALGRTDDAAQFSALADETHAAFQKLLWDDHRQVYSDGIDTDHASLHTNMMAMAFGIVPADRRPPVMEFIKSRGMACSVYGSQFLMDAIYDAGDAAYGLSLLTSKDDRSWYNMIRAGSTITMEAWDNKFKPNQDWNHAWGAVPANIIPRKLMGVEPLKPGWGEFRVRPQTADLEWAQIRVPTIRGSIDLAVRRTGSKTLYTLTVPGNTSAHFELPPGTADAPRIIVNGQETQPGSIEGILRLPALGSGTHVIQVGD